jgi:predicted DNA-binding protein with PD1-like motif
MSNRAFGIGCAGLSLAIVSVNGVARSTQFAHQGRGISMHSQAADMSRLVFVRLDPHEDVLVSLRQAVEAEGIRNATFVSGVGSLEQYRVHVVETTNMPPGNIFFEAGGPYDILAVTGFVVDGAIHAHITFSDDKHTLGGHLEEGCKVLTFAIIAIAEVPDATFTGWDIRGPLT